MLIHADNRGVDHLDGGIIGSGDRVLDIASTRQTAASERSERASGHYIVQISIRR
jgi:hypothetical protein